MADEQDKTPRRSSLDVAKEKAEKAVREAHELEAIEIMRAGLAAARQRDFLTAATQARMFIDFANEHLGVPLVETAEEYRD